MRYKIDFDARANTWCVTIAGRMEVADFRNVVRELWHHDGYLGADAAIWDMSKCAVDFGFEGISGFVDWLADFKDDQGPYRVALIAPSDIGFGNSRIYAGMQGVRGFEIEVFRDRELVYQWIGDSAEPDSIENIDKPPK